MNLNAGLGLLIGLLNQETELYRSMQIVVDREKDAAVQSDLEALNEAGLDKEKLMVELQKKDEKRRLLVTELAKMLGYAVPDLTLTRLSQLVDEPLSGHLRQARRDLKMVLNQLQASNLRNRQLFEHSMNLVKGSFKVLGDLTSPTTVYYRSGNIHNPKSTGKCICSEI